MWAAYGDPAGTYGAPGATWGGLAARTDPTWLVQVADPVAGWVDRTCDVRSITVDAGRSSYVDAFSAAAAQIVFWNPAGIYSTWPDNSIWLQPGGFVTDVPIRAGSVLAGVVDWKFTGTTDHVADSWPGTVDAIATVTATDAFKQLARYNGGPRTAVGAGELSGARVNRLLDDAAYHGARAVDAGVVALAATTLDGTTIDLLHQTGEAEWGWLYVRGDGAVTFRGRTAIDTDPRMTTVQFTFTDSDAIVGACYGAAVVGADDDRIVNTAAVTPATGAKQTATDAGSVGWFGPRSWTRTDLPIATTTDALALAQLVVTQEAHDDRRIDAVEIDGAHPSTWPALAGARIGDRVRFVRTFPGGHQLDAELLVQGRSDAVVPAGDGWALGAWTARLSTSNALVIVGLGQWDVGLWDDALWGV